MITDEQLDQYRLAGTKVRVVRDADRANDVRGLVVAWDDKTVMIRKSNKRLVKLDRSYTYQPSSDTRPELFDEEDFES
jgi:RNase P/RNase MRP subunit p29